VDVDRRERPVPHSLRVLERRAFLEAVGGLPPVPSHGRYQRRHVRGAHEDVGIDGRPRQPSMAFRLRVVAGSRRSQLKQAVVDGRPLDVQQVYTSSSAITCSGACAKATPTKTGIVSCFIGRHYRQRAGHRRALDPTRNHLSYDALDP